MAIINTREGGTDWGTGVGLASADLNDTFNAVVGFLGEVRMIALSLTGATTKAAMQAQGWAICDGTTPAAQSISSPTITVATPNMENKFIRGSDDESSGTTGGSETHNHQWYNDSTGFNTYDAAGDPKSLTTIESQDPGVNADKWDVYNETDNFTSNTSTLPSYYELAFFIKVR